MKTCWRCKIEKTISEFYKRGKYHTKFCKPCYIEKYKRTPNQRKDTHLKGTYGITLKEYDELRVGQGDMCAICGEFKPLLVDHDHATGRVRGLLCSECNLGLGKFKDDSVRLAAALTYLEQHETLHL